MELEASDGKTYTKEKKPRIKKGYYKGALRDFKPLVDKTGKDIEGKFGKQAVLLFEVYDENSEQIKVEGKELVLAKVVYTYWKNKDGTYSSAVTKGSQTTRVLRALGWNYEPSKKLDTTELIGRICELNIDDYEAKWEENGIEITYKASTIKDLNPIEKEEEDPATTLIKEEQIKKLQTLLDAGHITREGYDLALEQLRR